jgi:RarD protein
MTKNLSIFKFWKPVAVILIWGVSFIATKYTLGEIKPLVIILFRQIIGVIVLVLFAISTKKSFKITLKDFGWLAIFSFIATIHLWIQITGLQYTSASNTGWIIGITPVFMLILGLIFFKEKITALQLTGIILSFFGLLLLVSKGDFTSINIISNKGDILVLISAGTWAIYSMVGKKITLNYSPLMTIIYLFLIMTVYIAPFTINRENINAVIQLSFSAWLAIVFLGIFCSAVAYVLWAEAMNEMPASKVGVFLYIQPFITFFAAWILLNEPVTFVTMGSGIIIVGGVVLVNRK